MADGAGTKEQKEAGVTKALNLRERSFINGYVKTRRVGTAALRAGYSDPSYGSALLQKPHIKSAMLMALEKAGLTDDFLAKKLKEGLTAKYPAQLYKDGAVKTPETPDFTSRAKFQDMTHKLRGDYAPERHEVTEKRVVININIESLKGLMDADALTRREVQDFIDAEIVREGEDGRDGGTKEEAAEGTGRTAEEDSGGERRDCGGGEAGGRHAGAVAETGPPEV